MHEVLPLFLGALHCLAVNEKRTILAQASLVFQTPTDRKKYKTRQLFFYCFKQYFESI